jgi:hypothetical protein
MNKSWQKWDAANKIDIKRREEVMDTWRETKVHNKECAVVKLPKKARMWMAET